MHDLELDAEAPRIGREEARIILKERPLAWGGWRVVADAELVECPIQTLVDHRDSGGPLECVLNCELRDLNRFVEEWDRHCGWSESYPSDMGVLPAEEIDLEDLLDRLVAHGIIDNA